MSRPVDFKPAYASSNRETNGVCIKQGTLTCAGSETPRNDIDDIANAQRFYNNNKKQKSTYQKSVCPEYYIEDNFST